MKTNIAAVAVAAIGLTAGAVGLASAGPGDPPAQAAATTTAPENKAARPGDPKAGGRHGKLGALGHAVHGDLIVKGKDGAFEKVTFDRGTLTASSASSLTLKRPDGVDVTVKLNDDTRYRGVENAAALQKDQPVAVVSKDGTATVVMQRDPDAPRREPKMRRPGAGPKGAPDGPPAAAPSGLEG